MPRKRRSYPVELKAREEALGHHRSLCAALYADRSRTYFRHCGYSGATRS